MTELEARDAITQGSRFGDVYPTLSAEDGERIRQWFLRVHQWKPATIPPTVGGMAVAVVPVEKKPAPFKAGVRKKADRPTGDSCFKCGGVNIQRTGTCETCFDCGESQGGCG